MRFRVQLTGNDGVLGLDRLLASIHKLNLDRIGILETGKIKSDQTKCSQLNCGGGSICKVKLDRESPDSGHGKSCLDF